MLADRMYPERVTPGTMSTFRERTRILMALYRVGGVSPWVRRALMAQLPASAVNGRPR